MESNEERYALHLGDNLEILPTLPADSVDSIVTDPPYGLGFMGKEWDHGVPGKRFWEEMLRVAKPGAHLLAFGGDRTHHRLMVAIEDAGWEIRTCLYWSFSTGFPKGHNVSVAIDRMLGAEREVVGTRKVSPSDSGQSSGWNPLDTSSGQYHYTAPATPEAAQWSGWNVALKPAVEIIVMARKPFPGTVAQNVLAWGTGAINVDGGRVGSDPGYRYRADANGSTFHGQQGERIRQTAQKKGAEFIESTQGRWPANLIHDGSDEVVGLFPVTGASKAAARGGTNPNPMDWGNGRTDGGIVKGHDDNGGSAARFFNAFPDIDPEDEDARRLLYYAKASKRDRDEGLEGFEAQQTAAMVGNLVDGQRLSGKGEPISIPVRRNTHATVKPSGLMQHLCRLVTQPGGVVLDPFMGSGSTGKAAMLEGFRFIGIEREPEYLAIAEARIQHAAAQNPQGQLIATVSLRKEPKKDKPIEELPIFQLIEEGRND